MNLDFRQPPAMLRPFVRRFIASDYELASRLVFRTWPTGHIYLIWFFGPLGNYGVAIDGEPQAIDEPLWLAGQTEYHEVEVSISERTSAVVCEFTPQAFWRLFGVPGRWLTGRTCLASALAGPAARAVLAGAPAECETCLKRMIAFLTQVAEGARPADEPIERALAFMDAHHGRVGIGRVAAHAGVSPRHLTRRFTEVIGLTPKFYTRVLQINQVVGLLFPAGHDSLAGVAQDAGFYDQSHLNRAMKLFFAEGPTAFLRSDNRLFRTFLEKENAVRR